MAYEQNPNKEQVDILSDTGQNHDKGVTLPTVFSKMGLGSWHATCAGEANGVAMPDE